MELQEQYFLFQSQGVYYPFAIATTTVTLQVITDVIVMVQDNILSNQPVKLVSYQTLSSYPGRSQYLVQYMTVLDQSIGWQELVVAGGLDSIDKVAEVVGYLLNEKQLADGDLVLLGWQLIKSESEGG